MEVHLRLHLPLLCPLPSHCVLQAVCRTVFQSQRKAFNSKARRLEGEAAKLLAEAEKKAKRGAVTGTTTVMHYSLDKMHHCIDLGNAFTHRSPSVTVPLITTD
jgi:hypothetical protein